MVAPASPPCPPPLVGCEEVRAVRYAGGTLDQLTETVVREVRIPVFIRETEVVRLLALPTALEDLALGFLRTEGVIDDLAAVAQVTVVPQSQAVMVQLVGERPPPALDPVRSVTTGCGRGLTFISPLQAERFPPVTSSATIEATAIVAAMRALQRCSPRFDRTGGVHSTCHLAQWPSLIPTGFGEVTGTPA